MSVQMYGHSDDVVSPVRGGESDDEFGEGEFLVGTREAGVLVEFRYGDRGGAVWRASLRQVDENVAIPWGVSVGVAACAYSVAVTVGCPDDTPVARVRTHKELRHLEAGGA